MRGAARPLVRHKPRPRPSRPTFKAGNSMIVGRDAESAAISNFLCRLAQGPGVLLIEGEAGIGKTTLLTVARSTAAKLGYTVLSAFPSQAELPLAFAGLTDLLEWVPAAEVARLP